MTPLEIGQQIEGRIQVMAKARASLNELASSKANTCVHYEKKLAITLLRLKNGDIPTWEGQAVDKIPATIMSKVAQGMCHESKLEAELAESAYKSHVIKLDCMKAELNGYQSVNRHLDNTGR